MTRDLKQEQVILADPMARQLVLAGPGTGKTETVARRIVRLLGQGVRPRELLVLSFSRSAVATLIRRIELVSEASRAHLDDLRHVSVRTFDSWTFRALRMQASECRLNSPARANLRSHSTWRANPSSRSLRQGEVRFIASQMFCDRSIAPGSSSCPSPLEPQC